MRLKNRNRQIPGGIRYFVPQTRWRSTPWASFDSIVRSLIKHRQGNPRLSAEQGWSTDYEVVADEIDAFNAMLCHQNNWLDYIMEGNPSAAPPPPPKSMPQRIKRRVGNLAAGGRTLVDWIGSGGQPVERMLAESRARVCSNCKFNVKGTLTDWFTLPLANLISEQIEQKNNMKLATGFDSVIGLCEVCECPLKLKIWAPLEHVLQHIPAETLANLPPHCWIVKRDEMLSG